MSLVLLTCTSSLGSQSIVSQYLLLFMGKYLDRSSKSWKGYLETLHILTVRFKFLKYGGLKKYVSVYCQQKIDILRKLIISWLLNQKFKTQKSRQVLIKSFDQNLPISIDRDWEQSNQREVPPSWKLQILSCYLGLRANLNLLIQVTVVETFWDFSTIISTKTCWDWESSLIYIYKSSCRDFLNLSFDNFFSIWDFLFLRCQYLTST